MHTPTLASRHTLLQMLKTPSGNDALHALLLLLLREASLYFYWAGLLPSLFDTNVTGKARNKCHNLSVAFFLTILFLFLLFLLRESLIFC